jgi:hypothetical protein
LLIKIYDILFRIENFDGGRRSTKPLAMTNYKEQLDNNGLFFSLKEFIENTSILSADPLVTIYKTFFNSYINEPYDGSCIDDFTRCNTTYYNSLKSKLDTVISQVTNTNVPSSSSISVFKRGGNIDLIQTGGFLPDNQKNIYDNLMNTITEYFVSFVASLNDITMSKVPGSNIPIDSVINTLGLSELQGLNTVFDSNVDDQFNTKKILLLMQVFFENTYNSINETEQIIESLSMDIPITELSNNIEQVKNLYASMYIFFECLYMDTIPATGTNPDTGPEVMLGSVFCNEYLSPIVRIVDPYRENIKAIINKCTLIRSKNVPQNKINNIVLFVFTCVYSLINMFVEKYAKEKTENTNQENNYGYYPSLIYVKYRSGAGSNSIFTPFERIASTTYSISNINYGERALFSRIDIILIAFLKRILDGHSNTYTYINQQVQVSNSSNNATNRIGGKRTRKNRRKQRKLRKTMKQRKTMRKK